MRIAIGADHAGFEMKADLAAYLARLGHDVTDIGAHFPASVDYPDIAAAVSDALRSGLADRGVLICGSGAGAAVAASKFPRIRAAVCHDTYTARQAVEHDDLNVLCLGARVVGSSLARELAEAFVGASFSGEERHVRRLAKVEAIESRFARDER